MADEVIPPFYELDYLHDLTLFQHPPCMFILWWIGLATEKIIEKIKELLNKEGGDSEEGDGGDDAKKGDDGGEGGDAGDGGEGGDDAEKADDAGGEEEEKEE